LPPEKQKFALKTFRSPLVASHRRRPLVRSKLSAKTQGKPIDIGGDYQPDDKKASAALRPSKTFNDILATL